MSDSLSGDAEFLTDYFESFRVAAVQSESLEDGRPIHPAEKSVIRAYVLEREHASKVRVLGVLADGVKGLSSAKCAPPSFLDLQLPDALGDQVYKTAKQIDPDLNVIVIQVSRIVSSSIGFFKSVRSQF